MALFKLIDGKAKKILRKEFNDERKELQPLIDNNLDTILGIRFIEKWYPIPNGEIDTLGLDDSNVPVIIEYKRKKDPTAINQGLFYLQWLKQNKRTFEMLVREKLGKDIKVNWSQQPRLIIIAQEFSPWDLAVVNEVKSPIELKKYSYYGEMLSIEDVNIIQTKIKGKIRATEKEEVEYTLDRHLKKATKKTKELFEELRKNILNLGDDVEENPTKWWIQYKAPIIFAGMMIHKNKIRIWIKIDEETLKDPKKIIKKMKWHPPHYFDLNSKDELPYAMELIKQAYLYVSS
jgi:predicted transport protein